MSRNVTQPSVKSHSLPLNINTIDTPVILRYIYQCQLERIANTITTPVTIVRITAKRQASDKIWLETFINFVDKATAPTSYNSSPGLDATVLEQNVTQFTFPDVHRLATK